MRWIEMWGRWRRYEVKDNPEEYDSSALKDFKLESTQNKSKSLDK